MAGAIVGAVYGAVPFIGNDEQSNPNNPFFPKQPGSASVDYTTSMPLGMAQGAYGGEVAGSLAWLVFTEGGASRGSFAEQAVTSGRVSNTAGVDALAARRDYLNLKFDRAGDLNLDINIRGNQEVASNYFRSQGISEADANAYMKGIDFSRQVDVQTLNVNKPLWQYQAPGAPQGNWYSFDPNLTPSELGINPDGMNRAAGIVQPKMLNQYMTGQPVSVLRNTAAAVEDTWSVPGKSYPAVGGERQIFTPPRKGPFTCGHVN